MGGGAHLAVLGELGHAQRAVAGLELVRLGVPEPARGELLLERRHLLVARHVAEEVAAAKVFLGGGGGQRRRRRA